MLKKQTGDSAERKNQIYCDLASTIIFALKQKAKDISQEPDSPEQVTIMGNTIARILPFFVKEISVNEEDYLKTFEELITLSRKILEHTERIEE